MIQISSGLLTTFKECKRCAWLEKNKKVKRPRGKFPSLPNGMDAAFKRYSDAFRSKNTLPQGLENHPDLAGFKLLSNEEKIKAWRQWNSKHALRVVTEKWTLVGGLDEVFYSPKDLYIPADYKTASSSDRSQEDAEEYHKTQLDTYSLLLESNKYKTAGFGVIMLWAPVGLLNDMAVQFNVSTLIIKTDPRDALVLCEDLVRCVESDVMPPAGEDCEYCSFVAKYQSEMPSSKETVAA